MTERYLGMYVHMHWGYNHPYAARTWTLDDWRSYAGGLAALGFNLVMIWPMLEIIPDPPTESDKAHLAKISQVIDLLHSEFGMKVLITLGANVMGNDRARQYPFETRPYFESDQRLDPGNQGEVDRLIWFRRGLYSYLAKADGCSVIDSDPGGYIGSTNDEFTNLLWRHIDMIREYNPEAVLYYWMWAGWEAYNRMWKDVQEGIPHHFAPTPADFEPVIGRLMERPQEPWRVLSCQHIHQEVVEKLGIEDRALFYPYGLVEKEPTFPRSNCDVHDIHRGLERYSPDKTRLGLMANSQSHCLQLANTYLFAHFAKGGTLDNVDLAGFADGLVPGSGGLIAQAWETLNEPDPGRVREVLRLVRERAKSPCATGPYSGLLLQSPELFLEDLALQLEWHADMRGFAAAVDHGADWHKPMQALVASWGRWYARTGFSETHCSPEIGFIHGALRHLRLPSVDAVLDDLEDWREPAKRHGLMGRLLDVMRSIQE